MKISENLPLKEKKRRKKLRPKLLRTKEKLLKRKLRGLLLRLRPCKRELTKKELKKFKRLEH
jgi:hypothetical protein